jgi:hypothetical protein
VRPPVHEGHQEAPEEGLLADARAQAQRDDAREAERRQAGQHANLEDVPHLPQELELVRLRDGERQRREQRHGPQRSGVEVERAHAVQHVGVHAQERRRHLGPDAHQRVERDGG